MYSSASVLQVHQGVLQVRYLTESEAYTEQYLGGCTLYIIANVRSYIWNQSHDIRHDVFIEVTTGT